MSGSLEDAGVPVPPPLPHTAAFLVGVLLERHRLVYGFI